MAKEITELTDRIVSVTRRGFLGKAGRALAATAVPLQLVQAAPSKRGEMASALHDAVAQLVDAPTHVRVFADGCSLDLEVEDLRDNSVDQIQDLLGPLFGDVS